MAWNTNAKGWKQFLLALATEYNRDNIGDVAGSVTFFAVLALFPFLVFVISVTSLFIDVNDVQRLLDYLWRVAPAPVAQLVGERISSLLAGTSPTAVAAGAVGAIWAASGAVVSITSALNTVHRISETRPFWKVRLMAVGVTVGAMFVSSAVVSVALVLPRLHGHLGEPFGHLLGLLRWPMAAALMMFLWASIYYVLPDLKQRFRIFTPGSVIGVLLWLPASLFFSIYADHFGNYDATYGALGGAVVLLLWMWISAQVVLVGAEINVILDRGVDKKPKEQPAAVAAAVSSASARVKPA